MPAPGIRAVTDFLTSLPEAALLTLVVGVAIALSVAGLLAVRSVVPHPVLQEHNDVAGFIFAVVGVVYAVLLAFVAIAEWENFENLRVGVEEEAAEVVNTYRAAAAFPDAERDAMRNSLVDYADTIVNTEWSRMEKGEASPDTERELEEIWLEVQNADPQTAGEINSHAAMLDDLGALTVLREGRLDGASAVMPDVMVVVLVLGGAITVAYTYLYGVRNTIGQAAMTAALAGIIGLVVGLAIIMDAPFRGSTAIEPTAFENALEAMEATAPD
ncbi:MAG: DUF4239 domain-containing protein [Dehalococcoidia bacterium]|nr:DUF4239 domain-containing protein [Dehalococcoidia bacterium]